MKSKAVNPVDEEVKKVLALKRHEQPPPRFFQGFSDEVIDRIHTAEPGPPPNLRERLGLGEDWKPVLLCGLGVVACLVLGLTLVAAIWVEKPGQSPLRSAENPAAKAMSGGSVEGGSAETIPGYQTLGGTREGGGVISPVVVPGSTDSPFLKGNPGAYQDEK